MARKGENIYKRKDGRWEGRYIKALRPGGRALYGSVYGSKYSEVKDKLLPLKSAYASLRHEKVSFIGTVRDWITYWLNEIEKPTVKESTYASYRNKMENHVFPFFGNMRLNRLSEGDIRAWIDGLTAKGLSGSSVRTIFRIFDAALQQAVYKHCLFCNPCRNAVLPRVEKTRVRALTLAQQKELETKAFETKGSEAVIISLYTGMRVGEISALTWDDIDFESNMIYVRKTLQRIPSYELGCSGTKIVMDTPKSAMSCRAIPFANRLKTYLLDKKKKSTSGYVVSAKGGFAEPRVISSRFRKVMNDIGLGQINFHALRHTYATRCIERGIDIVTLSRLLGHASSKMTLDTYADSTMEQRQKAMASLDLLLSRFEAETRESEKAQKGYTVPFVDRIPDTPL